MGHLDSPLTEQGRAQAEAVARRLAPLGPVPLYSSDLGRAWSTADAIGRASGATPIPEPGLREHHAGLFQGLTMTEMHARHGAERAAYDADLMDYVIPGGESGRQRATRALAAIDGIAERHPQGIAIAVTHAGIVLSLFEQALALPVGQGARFRRDNASYNSFLRRDGRWVLETWNDMSHLG